MTPRSRRYLKQKDDAHKLASKIKGITFSRAMQLNEVMKKPYNSKKERALAVAKHIVDTVIDICAVYGGPVDDINQKMAEIKESYDSFLNALPVPAYPHGAPNVPMGGHWVGEGAEELIVSPNGNLSPVDLRHIITGRENEPILRYDNPGT